MEAAIDIMFVNEKISEYIKFVPSHYETQDKRILGGVLWQKKPWHPKLPHRDPPPPALTS